MQIDTGWQDQTVEQYLKKELQLTAAQIRSLKFLSDGIRKNGMVCKVIDRLQKGDWLDIPLPEKKAEARKVEPSGVMPEILYSDRDVICVWKPSGRVTHPVAGHRADNVTGDLMTYLQSQGLQETVHSIGRLDKDTAGILVFARHRIAAARLWQQREDGRFIKEYLAWCEGVFPEEAQWQELELSAALGKVPEVPGQGQRMQVTPTGSLAVTCYQVICQEKERALVRLHLKTGRTHQIRVHMAYIGHPLVGDSLYGHGIPHQDAAMLCAWKVRFYQPFTKEEIVLEYRDPVYSVQKVEGDQVS